MTETTTHPIHTDRDAVPDTDCYPPPATPVADADLAGSVCALPGCETLLEPLDRGRARRYCCIAHRKTARRQRRETLPATTPATPTAAATMPAPPASATPASATPTAPTATVGPTATAATAGHPEPDSVATETPPPPGRPRTGQRGPSPRPRRCWSRPQPQSLRGEAEPRRRTQPPTGGWWSSHDPAGSAARAAPSPCAGSTRTGRPTRYRLFPHTRNGCGPPCPATQPLARADRVRSQPGHRTTRRRLPRLPRRPPTPHRRAALRMTEHSCSHPERATGALRRSPVNQPIRVFPIR
jgi:hypothetical protein